MGRRGAAVDGADGALVEGASLGSVGCSMLDMPTPEPISISASTPHTFWVTWRLARTGPSAAPRPHRPSAMSNPWPEPPNYYDTPTKGYKVMLQTPGFPVIYQEPSVSQVGAYFILLKPLHSRSA